MYDVIYSGGDGAQPNLILGTNKTSDLTSQVYGRPLRDLLVEGEVALLTLAMSAQCTPIFLQKNASVGFMLLFLHTFEKC